MSNIHANDATGNANREVDRLEGALVPTGQFMNLVGRTDPSALAEIANRIRNVGEALLATADRFNPRVNVGANLNPDYDELRHGLSSQEIIFLSTQQRLDKKSKL